MTIIGTTKYVRKIYRKICFEVTYYMIFLFYLREASSQALNFKELYSFVLKGLILFFLFFLQEIRIIYYYFYLKKSIISLTKMMVVMTEATKWPKDLLSFILFFSICLQLRNFLCVLLIL